MAQTPTRPIGRARTAPTDGHGDTPATKRIIELDDLPVVHFTLRLVGTQPLITNRFSEEAIDKIEAAQTGSGRAPKVARDPEAEFESGIYRLPDGRPGMPGSAIKKAIRFAAMRMTGGEAKGTVVAAAFNVMTDPANEGLVLLEAPDPKMRRDHIVRQNKGGIAYRPEFWPWAMTVQIALYLPSLSVAEFAQIARMAGFGIGIGNWRPEKGGDHGVFSIEIT